MNIRKKTISIAVLVLLLLSVATTSVLATVPPPDPKVGTGSPGYWKNHPEAWLLDPIILEPCGVEYEQAEAIALLDSPVKGDKSITLFKALVAAMLNIANGTSPCSNDIILTLISDAQEWMCVNDSPVKGSSDAWQRGGEKMYLKLDLYNNGESPCAPSRD